MYRCVPSKPLMVLVIVVTFVIYGSLYPFDFYVPPNGAGALQTLLSSWATPPLRGDFLSNTFFYVPVGFFGVLATRAGMAGRWRFALSMFIGATLSIAMELIQYYDPSRITSADDVYSNILGTAIGALGGTAFGHSFRWPMRSEIRSQPFPTLLLASWLGYRLYPLVPTIDLHKYWDALKPVVLHPSFTGFDFFRYMVMWLTVAALIEAIARDQRSRFLFPLFAAIVLFAKILIVSRTLTLSEIAGAGAGYVGLLVIIGARRQQRALLVLLLLFAYVLAWRLEPFEFGVQDHRFSWIPFRSFMDGSVEVNVQSFFEKFFYYGSLVWFSTEAGLRLRTSALIVALFLLITSWAEVYLPRSAEDTDAIMALGSALIAWLMSPVSAGVLTMTRKALGAK